MDTVTLVENQIDDGQRLLDRLAGERFIVRAACWVKPFQEDRWTLYIATPAVDEKGAFEAYGEVLGVLRSLGTDWITSSDVTLVSAKHPIAKDALDILRRFPHNTPIKSPRSLVGRISVEEIYVYRLGTVEVPIYHVVYLGAPPDIVGILSLDPLILDSSFSVEVGTGGQRKAYEGKTGLSCVVAAPEGAKLERDEIGQMVLSWELHGKRIQSNANEVWGFAKLGLHGFRVLREASPRVSASSCH